MQGYAPVSIGGGGGATTPFYLDPIAIGAYGAVSHGVFVATSSENEGSTSMSVTNVAPWLATVGAGTINRNFPIEIVLGNGRRLSGVSLYSGKPLTNSSLPLYYPGRTGGLSASLCVENSIDPSLVKGKIVICDRGSSPRVAKGMVVKEAGGAAMVLTNGEANGEGLVGNVHVLPACAMGEKEGGLGKGCLGRPSGAPRPYHHQRRRPRGGRGGRRGRRRAEGSISCSRFDAMALVDLDPFHFRLLQRGPARRGGREPAAPAAVARHGGRTPCVGVVDTESGAGEQAPGQPVLPPPPEMTMEEEGGVPTTTARRLHHLRATLAGSLDATVSEADGLAGSLAMRCCLCGFAKCDAVARRLAADRSTAAVSKIQDLGQGKKGCGTHELGSRIGKLLEQIVF
jgi:hypothetical protein